jgi:hypothetical protein
VQIKVYSIEIPRWVKKALLFVGVPGLVFGIGAVVRAANINTLAAGDVISAKSLNENFSALNAEIGSLNTRIATLEGRTVAPSITVVDVSKTIPGGGWAQVGASCSTGLLIGGGCRNFANSYVPLWEAFIGGSNNSYYYCSYSNNMSESITVHAYAHCLTIK